METWEIVHVGAKDLRTAVYVGVQDGTRFVVGTDNLCPDCSTPKIVLQGHSGQGALRMYHDPLCVSARYSGGETLSDADYRRVVRLRAEHRDATREVWRELA